MNNRNQKPFEALELKDDFMFGKVMRNPKICKKMLEILLGIEIEAIEYLETQKSIRVSYQGKRVCMDVYVADNKQTVYNAEMQQSKSTRGILPHRSRYYQGMIDSQLLENGKIYTELKKSYIIFICTFQSRCKEEPDLLLEDGATRVFFNTKGNLEAAPKELKELLEYIESKKVTGSFSEEVAEEVSQTKQNEEWRSEYMKELFHDYDIREEGRLEGRLEGIEEGKKAGKLEGIKEGEKTGRLAGKKEGREETLQILKQHTKQIPSKEIASSLQLDISYVEQVIAEYEKE